MFGIIAILWVMQTGTWGPIPPMPDARQEVGVVAVEGRVYVIGGLTTSGSSSARVDVFDTRSGTWQAGPSLPINIHHPMVAAVGRRVYVAGGYTDPGFTAHAHTYELDTDLLVWKQKADMPTLRGAGAAVSSGGKLYVIGGERNGLSLNDVAAYDPGTDSWNVMNPMPTPRNHHGAALVGGRIYVIGGRPGNLSSNEAFDVVSETWTARAPLPTARSGIAVAALGQQVYVFGGEGNRTSPVGTFSENEAYDVDADKWSKLEAMPFPRHGIGAGVVGNRIYIPAGGPVEGFGTTAQSDFFEVAQDVVLPQFVVGGGYRTEIFVSNPAARTAEVQMTVVDINGSPLTTAIDGVPRDSVSFIVPPLASRAISAADTSGPLRAGTVRLRSNARVNAFANVRLANSSVVTVYPVSPQRRAIFLVRLARSEQTNTGVAIANTNIEAAGLVMTLVNESGNEVARIERTLEAGGQLSRFVDELFIGLQQGNFQGTVTVTSNQPLSIVALAFGRDGVVTIPVVPIE